MSGPVDVLAVLDDLHRGCRMYSDSQGRANRSNYADDLVERRSPEARAAVAELIEVSASALYDMREIRDRCTSLVAVGLDEQVEETIDRLANALANAGGAA